MTSGSNPKFSDTSGSDRIRSPLNALYPTSMSEIVVL